MPTVKIQYQPARGYESIVVTLVKEMPGIVFPEMNIAGRELHDGAVGEKEIIVEATEHPNYTRNINHIQVTVIAHAFEERVQRIDQATEAVKQGIMNILRDFDRNVKVGVSIWLIQMGYATIS